MPQPSPLLDSLQQAMDHREKGMGIRHFDYPLPTSAPDFFSNDYLSLSSNPLHRDIFLRRIQDVSPTRLFGATGSRLMTGNSSEINALENAFKHFFDAPSAFLFSSGFEANVAFLTGVPRKGDVIVYDESVHASCRDGVRLSSSAGRTSYSFAHNSVAALEACLVDVLQKHPLITQGTTTVFVVLESLYSMDGDYCPLVEMVDVVEARVPAGHAHIIVDEAHTTGTCGPNGTGYVSLLGLNDRVHTKVHVLSKGWGFHGGVVLTSPVIKEYLGNFTNGITFSTSVPYTDIYALEACLSVISSAAGEERRRRLHRLARYARDALSTRLKTVPKTLLAIDDTTTADPRLCSQVIPVHTSWPRKLASYLIDKGYAATQIMAPIAKTSRIRVSIHAKNTEAEIDGLINELLTWARQFEVLDSAERVGGAPVDTASPGVALGGSSLRACKL